MNTLFCVGDEDADAERVGERIEGLAGPDPVEAFGNAIRQSIDEVLDGPRTGRWDFDQLEKTEKTYVGTKLEIVVRTALGLEPGPKLDLEVDGIDVDVKWGMNSGWQIPREAVDQLCL
jgi:plasmid stabilization system protein ParE